MGFGRDGRVHARCAFSALVCSLGLLHCGESTSTSASGTASAPGASSVSSAPPAASSAPAAPPFDTKAFCDKLCKRSTDCGIEKAEALAKSGEKADVDAVTKAKAEAETVKDACVMQCTKDPPQPTDEKVKKVEACHAEKDCAAFRTCIEGAAK
jgi:hypothetical protein